MEPWSVPGRKWVSVGSGLELKVLSSVWFWMSVRMVVLLVFEFIVSWLSLFAENVVLWAFGEFKLLMPFVMDSQTSCKLLWLFLFVLILSFLVK